MVGTETEEKEEWLPHIIFRRRKTRNNIPVANIHTVKSALQSFVMPSVFCCSVHSLTLFIFLSCSFAVSCLFRSQLNTHFLSVGLGVCVCVWISFTRLFDGCCLKLSCLACVPPPLSGFRLLLSHLYLKPSDTLTLLRWHDSVFQQKCSLFFTWLYCMAVCVCVCFSCSKNSIRENNHPNRWRARSFAWVWYVLVCVWRALKNREREKENGRPTNKTKCVVIFIYWKTRERKFVFPYKLWSCISLVICHDFVSWTSGKE